MPESSTPASPRPRRTLVGITVCLATLLAFLGVFALWADRQLLNTDNWTEMSSELLQDGAIRSQLSAYLVDQVYANLDVQKQIEDVLPEQAQALAAPAASGLRNFAERGTNELLSRPKAEQAWEAINRRAHTRLLQVLDGGTDVVSTEGGTVSLDLKALLTQSAERIGIGGRIAEKLPPGAGQIVILKSGQLETTQNAARLLDRMAPFIVVLSILLFLLAIYLARGWRLVALRWWGIGFIVAGVGALIARNLVGGGVVDSLATTEAVRPAVENTWTIATQMLVDTSWAAIGYGIVLVVCAWLGGSTRTATAARRLKAPYLREPAIAFGGGAVLILLLVWWSPTPAWESPIAILGLAALLGLGIEALRRKTAVEFPDADRAVTEEHVRAWISGVVHGSPHPPAEVVVAVGPPPAIGDGSVTTAEPPPGKVRPLDNGTGGPPAA
jgi:hypothetical protein